MTVDVVHMPARSPDDIQHGKTMPYFLDEATPKDPVASIVGKTIPQFLDGAVPKDQTASTVGRLFAALNVFLLPTMRCDVSGFDDPGTADDMCCIMQRKGADAFADVAIAVDASERIDWMHESPEPFATAARRVSLGQKVTPRPCFASMPPSQFQSVEDQQHESGKHQSAVQHVATARDFSPSHEPVCETLPPRNFSPAVCTPVKVEAKAFHTPVCANKPLHELENIDGIEGIGDDSNFQELRLHLTDYDDAADNCGVWCLSTACGPSSSGDKDDFCHPNQTIIIFDWDDTLCPSSACTERHGLSLDGPRPEGELADELAELSLEVLALIERARELADRVVIVTNATEGWVEKCCDAWMPQLEEVLGSIHVSSARTAWEPCGVRSPTGWKEREFGYLIGDFYSQYPSQSWANIMAVGDAPFEHEALKRVVNGAPWWKSWHCRSKSVNFAPKPSIAELKVQVQALRQNLGEFVAHDGNLETQCWKD